MTPRFGSVTGMVWLNPVKLFVNVKLELDTLEIEYLPIGVLTPPWDKSTVGDELFVAEANARLLLEVMPEL